MSHKPDDTWLSITEAYRPDDMHTEAAIACRDLAGIIQKRAEKLEETGIDLDLSTARQYVRHLEELAKKLEDASWRPRGPEEQKPLPMERMWFRHRVELYGAIMDVVGGVKDEAVLEEAFGYELVLGTGADNIIHRWHGNLLWEIERDGKGFHWKLWGHTDHGVSESLLAAMRAAQKALDEHSYI